MRALHLTLTTTYVVAAIGLLFPLVSSLPRRDINNNHHDDVQSHHNDEMDRQRRRRPRGVRRQREETNNVGFEVNHDKSHNNIPSYSMTTINTRYNMVFRSLTHRAPVKPTPKPTRKRKAPTGQPTTTRPSASPTLYPTLSPTLFPTSPPPTFPPTTTPSSSPSSGPTIPSMNLSTMSRLATASLNTRINLVSSTDIMFDIEGINEVVIYSLSLSLATSDYVTYEVYSHPLPMREAPKDVEEWTLQSTGRIRGDPSKPTPLPVKSFAPLAITIGNVHALYIVLDAPRLRLARTEEPIGSAYNANNDVTQMVGVSDSSPRGWEGELYYRVTTIATTSPSTSPTTTMPTVAPRVLTHVEYKFRVTYGLDLTSQFVTEEVEGSVQQSLGLILKDVREGNAGVEYGIPESAREMSLVAVQGVFEAGKIGADDNCAAQDDVSTCAYLAITSTISHATSYSPEDVKFMFLAFKDFVADNLPFKQEYVGNQPLITGTKLSFEGDQLTELESNDLGALEAVVKDFLVKQNPDVDILKVKVTGQNISLTDDANNIAPRHRHHENDDITQRHRHLMGSSIDIMCTITGEYMPPPEVNFESVVEDSFSQEAVTFMDELKKEVVTFEKVKEISVAVEKKEIKPFSPMEWASTSQVTRAEETEPPPSTDNFWQSNNGQIVMMIGGGLAVLTAIVILFSLAKRRFDAKKKKTQPMSLDMMMTPGMDVIGDFMGAEETDRRRREKQKKELNKRFSEILGRSSKRVL